MVLKKYKFTYRLDVLILWTKITMSITSLNKPTGLAVNQKILFLGKLRRK